MAGLGASIPLLGASLPFSANNLDVVITEGFGVTYIIGPVRAKSATLSQGVGANDAPVGLRGVVLLQKLGVALAQVPNSKTQVVSANIIQIASEIHPGLPVLLTSGVGVALAQKLTIGLQVIENLGLTSILAAQLTYRLTSTETIRMASALSRFLGASLTSGVGITPTQVSMASRSAVLAQGIGVNQAQTPCLLINVTSSTSIRVSATDALKMLFKPTLAQGIELTAAYFSPTDGITTWAMNTRSAAVTEYSNYAFNSFASMDGKYLGAASDGLYELVGDTDFGTNIIADIKSGFAQWAGTKFTSFKAAYLGVRGEGNFVLRLISGEGATYDYAVSTRDMRSTRVHIGKGVKARYFAFELISTGQDFDLDSIEFVPLVSERRV